MRLSLYAPAAQTAPDSSGPLFGEPKMMSAYRAGRAAGEALQPGVLFTGAYGAADAAGQVDRVGRAAFITGYLDVVERRFPNGVLVDAEGRLSDNLCGRV